jgi:hypothetical protein
MTRNYYCLGKRKIEIRRLAMDEILKIQTHRMTEIKMEFQQKVKRTIFREIENENQ